MNLLPKSYGEFSSKNYWNKFFKQRGTKAFEWYGEYGELCGQLHKYIKPQEKLLISGCGNSSLGADLYKAGFKQITNVDISEVVIKQMKKKYSDGYPEMNWICGNMLKLNQDDASYGCILDKGTLDALMSDQSEETLSTAKKYFSEVERLLKFGGRFVCISLLQEHILSALLDWFPTNGWIMRFTRCVDAEESQGNSESISFPVFVIICTKFKKVPNFKPILEVSSDDKSIQRVESTPDVKDFVDCIQKFSLMRHSLKDKIAGEHGQFSFDLHDMKSGLVRYSLHVVDSPKSSNRYQFSVFIVPHGRENEWLFKSPQGQRHLAHTAWSSRLVVVHLKRDQEYGTMEDVQAELSDKVVELAHSKLPPNTKIPFLSVGRDLGRRTEKFRGKSLLSGEFVVEDVQSEGIEHTLRQLFFMSNQNIVQSEAKLLPAKEEPTRKKKGGKKPPSKMSIDHTYLSCSHHLAMVASLALNPSGPVLLVGLGGGSLATYIRKYLPETTVTAVDIDKAIIDVAQQWFDFTPDSRLNVEEADGIEYIKKVSSEGQKYSSIMFDVDSKVASEGLSCPPKEFLQRNFLDQVASCLENPDATFVLNLACRDEDLKKGILEDIKFVFPTVVSIKIPGEVNNVLVCRLNSFSCNFKEIFEEKLAKLNVNLKKEQRSTEDPLDVREFLSNACLL